MDLSKPHPESFCQGLGGMCTMHPLPLISLPRVSVGSSAGYSGSAVQGGGGFLSLVVSVVMVLIVLFFGVISFWVTVGPAVMGAAIHNIEADVGTEQELRELNRDLSDIARRQREELEEENNAR